MLSPEYPKDVARRSIPAAKPDDSWRKAEQETPLVKIRVVRYHDVVVLAIVFPDGFIVGVLEAQQSDVTRIGIHVFELFDQSVGKILIEEKSHECKWIVWCSRSAAYCRQA